MPVQGDDLFSLSSAGRLAILPVPGTPASVRIMDGLPEEVLIIGMAINTEDRYQLRPSAGSAFYMYSFGPSYVTVGVSGRACKKCDYSSDGSLAPLYQFYRDRNISSGDPPPKVTLRLPDLEIEGYLVRFGATGEGTADTYDFNMAIVTTRDMIRTI